MDKVVRHLKHSPIKDDVRSSDGGIFSSFDRTNYSYLSKRKQNAMGKTPITRNIKVDG